jgi:hypothetical protein
MKSFAWALLACAWIFGADALFADAAPMQPFPGGSVIPMENSEITMKKERIDIVFADSRYFVTVSYEFANGPSPQSVLMGFPNLSEGAHIWPISDFKAFDGSVELAVEERVNAAETTSDGYRKSYWECFALKFAPNETKRITNTYGQSYETDQGFVYRKEITTNIIKYILTTGRLWKGPIGRIEAHIDFSFEPNAHASFNKPVRYQSETEAVMEFDNIKPDFDIIVTVPIAVFGNRTITATASSMLPPGGGYHYDPANVLDSDPNTVWAEGAAGSGKGEWLELATSRGLISAVYITNGYAGDARLFRTNNRLKRMRVEFMLAGTVTRAEEFELPDTPEQTGLYLKTPVPATGVRFIILEVYKGDAYDDTCIAGIQLQFH